MQYIAIKSKFLICEYNGRSALFCPDVNINADKDINITPGSQYNINIPQNKGLVFGADTQSLISDGENNFNINAAQDINLTPASGYNVNIFAENTLIIFSPLFSLLL